MKAGFFFLTSILFCFAANAQNISISGRIIDAETNLAIPGGTISLKSIADTNQSFTTYSDAAGKYQFDQLRPDSFRLSISSIGYETLTRSVRVDSANVDMGNVSIPRSSKELTGVTVTASAAPATQKGDTVQFSANQFKVARDADAEALIRKMPGITVENGTVTAQGEQVRRVTIDGREFFGDDATAAMRNLPAEIIDKIQVFDRLSDQAQFTGVDDGNAQREINIVTKASMRNGQFGRIYAGYGTDSRYSTGGNMTFFNGTRRISIVGQANNINQQNFASQDLLGATSNPRQGGGQRGGGGGGNFRGGGGNNNFLVGQQNGISKTNAIGINFSDLWGKKVEVTGSYFFNNNDNTNNQLVNRELFITSDSSNFYDEQSLSNNNNYNHRFNMRIEYKIDSFNTIIFTPRVRLQKRESFANSMADLRDGARLLSQIKSNENTSSNAYNLEGELLWRHAFPKKGRTISFNVESEFDKDDRATYLESINRYFLNGGETDSLLQFTDEKSNGYQLEGNIAYTEPVGSKGQLQFNYRPSFEDNSADQRTFQYDSDANKYSIFDDALSNKLDNTYTRHNTGASYRIGDRDNSFSIGADYQYGILKGEQVFPQVTSVKRTFSNVLPNIRFQQKFSPKSNLRIFYRTRTNVPSVRQLQNVVNIRNILFPSTGNPDLNQDYTHNLITRYSYTNTAKKTSFFANIYLQNTQDYITNASFLLASDSVLSENVTLRKGARLTKPVNLDGYWNGRSFFTFSFPLAFIKSNLNLNAGASYARTPGLIENQTNISNNYNYNAGAVIASNISEYVDFTVSYSANFNRVKNSIRPELNDNYFNHSAGLQLNLLSKNGWIFQNDLNNQLFRGLSEEFNQDYWLWNMSAGKKLLKNQRGELRLSVFDLLKQNQAIRRNVTENYIEDVQNDVLQQYFMLTFTYNLRNFGTAASRAAKRNAN